MKEPRIYKIHDNAGIALLIVLWVLILLSVIAGEFAYTMRNQVRMVGNFKESAQAYYIAVGGVNRAIYQLLLHENSPRRPAAAEDETDRDEALRPQWPVNQMIGPLPLGENAFLRVFIQNEGGKIDINAADRDMLNIMLNTFDFDEDQKAVIVDSILDWRDENSLHRTNGAEDDYYRSLADPYDARDADFESKQELLLVRGVTPDIYEALAEMVTVIPEPQEKKSDLGRLRFMFGNRGESRGKLNINAAPVRLLSALPDIEAETVELIDAYRKAQEVRSLSELRPLVNAQQFGIIGRYMTVDALPYYRIWAMGYTQNRVSETIEVLVRIEKGKDTPYEILEWRDAVDG